MTLFIRVINNYMSYKTKVIYTKPSAEVPNHTPSAEFTNLIDTYFSSGKILEKPVKSEDGLTATWTTVWKNEDAVNEFSEEDLAVENSQNREAHCTNHLISYSLEQDV